MMHKLKKRINNNSKYLLPSFFIICKTTKYPLLFSVLDKLNEISNLQCDSSMRILMHDVESFFLQN